MISDKAVINLASIVLGFVPTRRGQRASNAI